MLDKFGDYHLLHKIATGGMAEIYLARHRSSPVTSMPIAIKKILPNYSNNIPFVKMFLAEARIICNINHENIVKIYDFGKSDNLYYIAMEYVCGQSLGQLMEKLENRGKLLQIENIMEIAFTVLSGLEHAHNIKDRNGTFLNVVHLDMNPNNILISYKGDIKIVDFGIANATYTKILKNNLESIQGTFGYLSPEQCREETLDRRSDIFSVGIILYELLSGKPLYNNLANDAVILHTILNEPVEPLTSIRSDIPEQLSAIIHKAIEKDKDNRYTSAAEMMSDLHKFQSTLEFNPNAESLPSTLKQEFASHYIKMNKLLDKAQAEYLMDELFKDIANIEDLDMEERPDITDVDINPSKPKDFSPHSPLIKIFVFALIFSAVIGMGIYIYSLTQDKFISVSIFSNPQAAEILIDGIDTGKTTPNEVSLKEGQSYIIECLKGEYKGGLNYVASEKNNGIQIELKRKK